MPATLSRQQQSPPKPPPGSPQGGGGGGGDNGQGKRSDRGAMVIVIAGVVVVALLFVLVAFFLTRGDSGEVARAQARVDLRNRAQSSLQGRFNDAAFNPKVEAVNVYYLGGTDQLMVSYKQGKTTCVANVMTPTNPDGLFGIQPIPEVDASVWASSPDKSPHCYTPKSDDPFGIGKK